MRIMEEMHSPAARNPGLDAKPLFMLAAGECKYALGNRDKNVIGGYLFCGAPCAPTDVYCERHKTVVWQARKPPAFPVKRGR